MKAILPLPSFNPIDALPEHFVNVALNLSSLQEGTVIHLPPGTWSSMGAAVSDPRTRITHNGAPITPWELKMLEGLPSDSSTKGSTK